MAAFVRGLEQLGELVRVRATVRPYLEVTAIADRVMKRGGPALLFEHVHGSPFPLLINAFGSRRRMSLALGVGDLEEHARAIGDLVRGGAPSDARDLLALALRIPELAHIPPRPASKVPCQEIVDSGERVDLDALPILTCWPEDGGPFITLPQVITRDPETRVRNVGCYRMQKLDRRSTAMHWQVHKTGARHFRRAKEMGLRRLEVAVALGGDPALTYAATAPLPDGIDEWMFAGFLRKRAVATAKCKTVDLEVPADADFVLEGYVEPQAELVDEGPFGDHTGYYTPVDRFPRFHVTALTRRADGVFPATLVGPPPMEDAWIGKATERLFLPLLRTMFPEVVDMNLPVEGAFHNLVLVAIKKQYPYHAARLAHGLWGAGQMSFSKVICVLDDDVDVQDLGQVAWRLLANIDPKRDFAFVDGPIDQLDHGANQALWGSKVCIDGTRKWKEEGYTRDWPERCRMSTEVEARVDAMWPELGIPLTPSVSHSAWNGIHGADKQRAGGSDGSRGGPDKRLHSPIARVVAAARELVARARP
jgi:4-hydroxy-3-polyprenylbenzoate decarboxylase